MGILSGGLIHPIAIPLGCIIGVLVGFWFNEIKDAIMGTLQKVASTLRMDFNLGLIFVRVQSFGDGVQRWLRYHRLTWMRDLRKATKFGYWCISALGWLILSPFRLIWLCVGHPVAVARTIRALSIVCTTIVVLIASYNIYPEVDEIGRYALTLSVSAFSLMLSYFGAEDLLEDNKTRSHSNFFRVWSKYSRQGPVLYAVKSVLQHLLAMVATMAMFLIAIFVLFGGVASVLLFLLISLFMNALWIASSRHEHLLCVTVTLFVTVTSAILCTNYMHGVGLWLVALITGILSGLATEVVRQIVVFAFNNTVIYKFLGDTIGDPNRPEELKFGVTQWRVWRCTENLLDVLAQKLVSTMRA